MSCVGDTCGTGGGNIPKPGDPNNNGVLSATPAFGGIDINWTFPTTNPFAVAYTTIYRALSSDFNTAILLAPQVGGGFYYDPVGTGVEYFYWITFVSINGTVGDLIGPVSAVARSSIEKTIEELTGKIDAGVLAQSLKSEIARISENADGIIKESQDRADSQWQLALQILEQEGITNETVTKVFQETTERKEADSAVVTSINLLYAQAGGNAAAILEEATVRASADEALSSRVTSVLAKADANSAAIITESTARATEDEALGTRIDTVSASTGSNATAIQTEITARTNADLALGQRIDTVTAKADSAVAAVQTETTARIEADEVMAQQITTVETSLDENIAQVQINMESKIETVNGKVTEIGALYTAKVNVNGLIGGFGIYNDGTEVEAGFDVDRFWIGRTGANKRKPFIIQGNEVFIDQAVINQLSVTKISSGEVNAEWRMTGANGRIVVNNGAYMKVLGIGFGANSDLIEWFGPSMDIASCSKANAVYYLSTSGDAYFGGSLSAGTLRTAVTNPTFGAAENVITGPFGSNGNSITVVGSINMYSQESSYNYNFSAGTGNTTCAFTLYRTLAGGSETAVHSFFLPGNISYDNYTSPDDLSSGTISLNGSFTFVDPVKSTLQRTYRLSTSITYQEFNYTKKIAAPPVMDIGGSYDQRLTIVTTE